MYTSTKEYLFGLTISFIVIVLPIWIACFVVLWWSACPVWIMIPTTLSAIIISVMGIHIFMTVLEEGF